MDHKVSKAFKEIPDHPDHPDPQDPQDLLDPQDLPLQFPDLLAQQDPQERPVHPVAVFLMFKHLTVLALGLNQVAAQLLAFKFGAVAVVVVAYCSYTAAMLVAVVEAHTTK
jgi:hypothetical protein